MKRGEIWSYAPHGSPRKRTIVIVSADGVNDSSRRWLYAVELVDADPQDILSVKILEDHWISGMSLTRVLRDWFDEPIGSIGQESLDALDAVLRGALAL